MRRRSFKNFKMSFFATFSAALLGCFKEEDVALHAEHCNEMGRS